MARLDSAILHEIAGIVQSRSKVPDQVRILNRLYQITYLEDHRQRMEDAIRRHDSQLLNMLFGQLASKVKYQALRGTASRTAGRGKTNGNARATATQETVRPKRSTAKKPAAAPKRSTARKQTASPKRPTPPKPKKRANVR